MARSEPIVDIITIELSVGMIFLDNFLNLSDGE